MPPRHTFDDDESSDEESDVDPSTHPLQVSGYQDDEDQALPQSKRIELGEINVSLTANIQDSAAVVIGIGMLHNVDVWFSQSTQVGSFSTEVDTYISRLTR